MALEDSQNLQDSLCTIKSDSGFEDSQFTPQSIIQAECEREVQMLERDIRQQKESSVNAKTAITFDQLKKIYNLGKILGPQKEMVFDRICRAADIQRASLKNRLKQNKEKFEPTTPTLVTTPTSVLLDSPSMDSQNYLAPPTLSSFMMLPTNNEFLRSSLSLDVPSTPVPEDDTRLPPERILDLMQLGFPFEEVKQITELFDQCKELLKPQNPTLQVVMSQFSNVISTDVPVHLKLISSAFNLLEMGYSRRDVARTLIKERRQEMEDERPCKVPRLSPMDDKREESVEHSDGTAPRITIRSIDNQSITNQ